MSVMRNLARKVERKVERKLKRIEGAIGVLDIR